MVTVRQPGAAQLRTIVDHETASTAVAAIAATVMLEAMRVFISYLVFVLDQSARVPIATTVLIVILATGLAAPLLRLLGPSSAILGTAILLAVLRLTVQFVSAPGPRLILSAAAVIVWGWLTVALLVTRRQAASLGIVLGLALDLAVRIAFHGVDLPWMPDLTSAIVTVALIALLLAAAAISAEAPSGAAPGGLGALPLVALGPALAVYHLTLGNLGLAQVKAGLAYPVAAALLALGATLGVSAAALRLGRVRPLARVGLALLTAVSLWLFWTSPALAAVALIVAVAAGFALLGDALDQPDEAATPSRAASTFWFTLGMFLEVAILFAYYTFTGAPVFAAVAAAFFLAGALLRGLYRAKTPSLEDLGPRLLPAAVASLLLLASLIALF